MRTHIMYITLMTLFMTSPLVAQESIKYAIFDGGGVLVETDKGAAFKEVGYVPFLQFAAYNIANILSIKKMIHRQLLYPFLESLEERDLKQYAARDPENGLIPQIMCSHFKGALTDAQMRAKIEHGLKTNTRLHAIEKNMLHALTSMMFTPERFIKTQYLVPETQEFVRECVKNGLKPCIHSTWAAESFELLKAQNPEFFALFEDRIFISAQTGLMKPDPASFDNILTKLKVSTPAQCIFFDDRPENIAAARECGMHAELITSKKVCSQPWKRLPDFDKATETLNVLPSRDRSYDSDAKLALAY